MRVLALNAGSSSLKVALFALEPGSERCLARGEVERIGRSAQTTSLTLSDEDGREVLARVVECHDHVGALSAALDALVAASFPRPDAIGHRLVHGGPDHVAPSRVDASLRAALGDLVRFAPLHLPAELAILDAATARYPGLPEIACFDTAFHRTLPEVAERLPLPRELFDAGVRRYGFHGLSYEYIVETVGAATLGRAVIAHLGSGASMAAVMDGRSIDTTMALTPASGLMMGTRSGDLDPGVLVHLMTQHGYGAPELDSLVNARSGLLGVSGTTADMKQLLDASAHDEHAALAVEMFCYVARKSIGALAAALGGIDTLVFTGGIGERASEVRERIARGLVHIGIALDPKRNARSESLLSLADSSCRVLLVRADEERMIARHVARVLSGVPSA